MSRPTPPAVLAAAAIAFAATIVQYSLRHGRLVVPPNYDDVAYMADGLRRLDTLAEQGLRGFVLDYVALPPHSPYASLMAMISFALFGLEFWAPYLSNAVIIGTLLALTDRLLADVRFRARLPLLAFVLTIPIAGQAVAEFRPDILCGLATAGGVMAAVGLGRGPATADRALTSGVAFGAALLVKPAIFPLTVALMATAVAASIALEGAGWRRAMVPWSRGVAVAVAIPLPHLALRGSHYFTYIHSALFAPSKPMRSYEGSTFDQLRYYVDGLAGRVMLGDHLFLLAGALLVGGGLALRQGRTSLARLGAVAVLLVVALAIPAVNPVKQAFFGVSFTFLLAGYAVEAVALHLREGRRWQVATGGILLLGGVAAFQWPPYRGSLQDARTRAIHDLVNGIHEEVAAAAGGQERHVFLTTTGRVSPQLLTLLARRSGERGLSFSHLPLSGDLAEYSAEYDRADIVVAADLGQSEQILDLVSARAQDSTLALLRSRGDFVEVASLPTATPGRYRIFVKTRPAVDTPHPLR